MVRLILILSFLPALFWFFIFLKKDRFEPDPKSLLIKLFILGGVSAFLAAIIELFISAFFPRDYVHFFNNLLTHQQIIPNTNYYLFAIFLVIIFAAVEEIFKILVVRIFAYNDKHFNQIVDGAIFGISSALGFASIENLAYFTRSFLAGGLAALILIFLLRFFASSLLHSLATGTSGYYLAKAKFTKSPGIFWEGLLAAILIHSTFNLFILGGVVGLLFEVGFLIVILIFLLKKMESTEAQIIRNLILLKPINEPAEVRKP